MRRPLRNCGQGESYLVVRCGVEAEEGQAFPQELMVFPQSDPRELGGAAKSSIFAAGLVTLFSVAASLFQAGPRLFGIGVSMCVCIYNMYLSINLLLRRLLMPIRGGFDKKIAQRAL